MLSKSSPDQKIYNIFGIFGVHIPLSRISSQYVTCRQTAERPTAAHCFCPRAMIQYTKSRGVPMKKDYFTTGEFAAICGVSKQTLFYYDQQGIFCPDHVWEKTDTAIIPIPR